MKRLFAFILFLFAAFMPLFSVQALVVSDLSDTMSEQREGADSNHLIRFKNTNPISTASQTIQLTFDAVFNLTGVTLSELSLSHGSIGTETPEVVAASAAAGVWGAAIVGSVLTLTPPTDAGAGEIPGGEQIWIGIGSASIAGHIKNPSTAGSYSVRLGGVFGGTGLLRVPIVAAADGGFSVGFTVPGAVTPPPPTPTPPPGGGGPPVNPPPPVPEPVISNVRISAITATSAQVDWDTNVSAVSSFSFYDPSTSVETLVTSDGPSLSHRATLNSLTPNTNYSFVLRATDTRNHTTFYGPGGFRTTSAATIENVSGFQAVRQPDGGVRLQWTNTNQMASNALLRVTIIRRADRYPVSAADGQTVLTSRDQSFTDLPGNGSAFYTAFVTDGARTSSGALATVGAVSAPTPTPTPTPTPVPTPTPLPTAPGPTPSIPGAPTTPAAPTPTSSGGGSVSPTSTTELPGVTVIVPSSPSSTESVPTIPTNPSPLPEGLTVQTEWRMINGDLVLAKGKETPVILVGDSIVLRVSPSEEIISGQVEVDGSYYALGREATKRYSAAFVPAIKVGIVAVRLSIKTISGETRVVNQSISVVAPARIVQKDNDNEAPAQAAEGQVFVKEGSTWRALANSKQRIGEDGSYRFYVAAGTYRLEVTKEGWNTTRKQLVLATAGPIQGTIMLEKGLQNPLVAIDPKAGLGENVVAVGGVITENIAQVLDVLRTPETQAVAEIAAPLAVATTVGVTAAASAFNLFNYLRFFLTQPLLLLRRRRREKWGLVYHSLTKQPIELAVVRLLDQKTGALRQTRITDALGRFAFLAKPGSYRIEVVKPGFVFPTAILASQQVDVDFVDLYHGEAIDASASVTLTPNIPIDPLEKTETPKEIIRRKHWRRAQQFASAASLGIAGIALVLQPTPFMIGCTIFQVVAFLLFRRLAVPPKPKSWGIAYDGHTRKPLKQAVVRIFDKKYNKLLETQVTDRDGKYAFFAGKNVYYVTAERSGYQATTSKDIDLRKEAFGVVHEPLPLVVNTVQTPVPSSKGA